MINKEKIRKVARLAIYGWFIINQSPLDEEGREHIEEMLDQIGQDFMDVI